MILSMVIGVLLNISNDDHRVVARLADTEGQVSGAAAHRRHDEPVAAGAGIDIDGPCDHRALVFGRFVAEGRCTVGQRKIVVDGFRDVYVSDRMMLFFQKFGHRLAVDAVSSPPMVTSSLMLFSVKNCQLKRFSKSSSEGLAAHAQERTAS